MEIKKEENKISILNEHLQEVAYVLFPKLEENVVLLQSTYVDTSLRGLGIAQQLMELVCEELRSTNRKAVLGCSYAKEWFLKHSLNNDVLL